ESDREGAGLPEQNLRWVIKDNKVLYGGAPLAVLTVDPATTPRNIDLSFLNPKRTYEGIYPVEGDTLKGCVNGRTQGGTEGRLGWWGRGGKTGLRLLVFTGDKAGSARVEDLRGFVGIALSTGKEVTVGQVLNASPAEKAGMKKDDVVLKVGATDATDLRTV